MSDPTIEHTAERLGLRLREFAEPEFRESQRRFFREEVDALGVRTASVRRLAAAAAREYRQAGLPLDAVFGIAEQLRHGRVLEERVLGTLLLGKFVSQLGRRDWVRVDRWVDELANWAETDALCTEVIAPFLRREPELTDKLVAWTASGNRWRRRGAAVALVRSARRGELLDSAYGIADKLAEDRDDMVEKAVGWLLKEASRTDPRRAADYLLANIDRLSRTTIRYACEKLPDELRARVMST